jgi:chromosome segregation ATPase
MEKNSDLDATPSLAEIATTTPATATVSGNVDAGQSGDTDTDTSMSTGVVGTAITATASTESKVEKVKMTNNNPVEAKKPTPPHNERSPPPLESHDAATVHEEDAKEKKTQTLGEGNGQRKEQNTISTSAADSESSKKEPRVTENTIVPEIQKSATITPLHHDDDEASKQLELRCKELERQLGQAEGHIMTLQQQTAKQMEMEEENQQHLLLRFQEKEARLLEAAAEDHQQELALLRGDMDSRFSALKKDTDRERSESLKERDQIERLLDEAIASVEAAEREKKQALSRQGTDSAQYQQRQDRALGMAEDKLAQTMALLDDREDEVEKLNAIVKNLKSNMNEHKEGAHEAEEEIDELHTENDTLRHHVQGLDAQCAELKAKVSELEGASDKISGLKVCRWQLPSVSVFCAKTAALKFESALTYFPILRLN